MPADEHSWRNIMFTVVRVLTTFGDEGTLHQDGPK